MTQETLWREAVGTIVPRDYQAEDVSKSFQLWDGGEVGVLTRCFTGGGKTIMSCLKMQRWLERSDSHRCMVLSYEQELVRQFAEEIRDVLGHEVSLGIEMGSEEIQPESIPRIVVASRQSLMAHELATQEQREILATYGLTEIGLLTKTTARRAIADLRKEIDVQSIADGIEEFNSNYRCSREVNRVSRLYKFDWRDNWLLVMDEAHKYSMKLKTVGHVVEWFEKNSASRRSGITATPKRRDKVSIGTKLFPGISLDFPYTRAVESGYAVPFLQKFIQVESIDFRALKESAKGSQEKWDSELDRLLNTEKELARVCDPMLDMVGARTTLIFSPSVDMSQNVADYINARSECECPSCAMRRWYPNLLLGDGAKCRECGDFISTANITRGGTQAHCLHGGIPEKHRREVYRRHKSGDIQFLSVCGLCREGYNDPNVGCVSIFRPVSRAASSLAEQMKGRGSRPIRGAIDGMNSAQERAAAIAASAKPNCLIIDLVGVTGLAECASTVQIYAEGMPDSIIARAEEIALFGGVEDPREAIEQAQREATEEKERQRLAREADEQRRRERAEKRSRLDAEVKYSVHDVGTSSRDPSLVSDKMLNCMRFLGLEFVGWEPSRKQAMRMIGQLKAGEMPGEVARTNRVPDGSWKKASASIKQLRYLMRIGFRGRTAGMSPKEASDEINRIKGGVYDPALSFKRSISEAGTQGELDLIATQLREVFRQKQIGEPEFQSLVELGRQQRTKVF